MTFNRFLIGLFACLFPLLTLTAQEEEEERSSRSSSPLRIVSTPVEGLNPEANVGPVVLSQMPIPQVISTLQRLSGRTILIGSGIRNVQINFNSGDRITREDAIFAIENLLSMNGVQLVPIDDQFIRAVPSQNITRSGPRLLDDLPVGAEGAMVYSRIFQLEYLTAQEATRLVNPLLTGGRNQSAVVALVRNNSLLVIDSLSNLQFIQSVLADADRPGAQTMEVYALPLAHTPVRDAFRFMTQLQRTSHRELFRGTTFYQDNRTNQLIVSTSPAHIELIRKILTEYDQDVSPMTTSEIFTIRFANVVTVNSILNGIINNQRRIWTQRGFTLPGTLREGALDDEDDFPGAMMGPEGEGAEGEEFEGPTIVSTGEGRVADGDSPMMDVGMPQLQFSPYLSIFMNRNSSQIVAYGTPSDLERLSVLIESLDTETAPYTDSELMYLRHANTADVTRTITTLINSQRGVFSREGVQAPTRRESEMADAEGLKFSQFAIVVAERRANALLVFGTQADLERVRTLVAQLDTETAPLTESRLFRLRYAEANTVSNILGRIIINQRATFAREGLGDTARRTMEAENDETGNLVFSPFVTFMPDRRSNALLVYGTRQDMHRIEELISSIDVEAAPYTQSRVVYLQHSQAATIGGVLNNLINQQRRSFAQEGLRTGAEARATQVNNDSGAMVSGESGTEFSPFASVVADARTNSLLLYGTGGDLGTLQEIVNRMDIPVDPLTRSEVFQLRYAQATNLVGILNTIIRGQQQALQRVASVSRDIRTPAGEGGMRPVSEGLEPMQFSPYVTLVADRRSNTILGYGTASDLDQIRDLIERTDVEVAPITRSQVYQIQHGEATQVVQTLQTLITSQQRVREQEATLRRVFTRDNDNGEASGMLEGVSDRLIDTVLDGDEGFQFSPYISLVSDDRSNSVVAYGTAFDLQQVGDLIEKIDIVLPQVRIEVVIAEVALTGDMVSGLSAFGFQYRDPLDPDNPGIGDFGFQTESPSFEGDGTPPAFATSFTLRQFSLSSIFNVAQRERNVRVLSAPTIVTTHNRQAQINVGQARPIVTSTVTGAGTANDLTQRATVEYRDIGIELRVRPLIGTGSNIQMEIEQIVDTVVGTQTISQNVQPIIGTRRASSFISVRDQEVIVLGGLQSVDTTEVEGKVFLLGDLPLLGGLFRPTSERQEVRELIIFIKPHIVDSSVEQSRMSQEELEKTAVGREIDYFLREGRFPEQARLREIMHERMKDWPEPTSPRSVNQRVWNLPDPTEKPGMDEAPEDSYTDSEVDD